MKKFVIGREIPGVGGMNDEELGGAARASNEALDKLAPKVQWIHTYVTGLKAFFIYLAESEETIRKHAERSDFPANSPDSEIFKRIGRCLCPSRM